MSCGALVRITVMPNTISMLMENGESARQGHLNSGPDQEFVKGLGLISATTLVMGSMIGSGVFIVAADIARIVDSPALLIAAWLVTGFMTVVAALSYGELAAMMPQAGGQYVYLREALGPLWGFLYGWTLFLVIQCGTIAAVGVAFGKFLGVFLPPFPPPTGSCTSGRFQPIHLGPMVLGNMEVGLNTQNLVAIAIIVLLSIGQHLRRQDRSHRAGGVHHRESRGVAGTHPARRLGGQHAGGAAAQISARTSGSMRVWARCTKFQLESAGRPRWSPRLR